MGSSLNAIIESAPPKKNGSARRPHRRVGCEALAPSFRQLKESEKERERERERGRQEGRKERGRFFARSDEELIDSAARERRGDISSLSSAEVKVEEGGEILLLMMMRSSERMAEICSETTSFST